MVLEFHSKGVSNKFKLFPSRKETCFKWTQQTKLKTLLFKFWIDFRHFIFSVILRAFFFDFSFDFSFNPDEIFMTEELRNDCEKKVGKYWKIKIFVIFYWGTSTYYVTRFFNFLDPPLVTKNRTNSYVLTMVRNKSLTKQRVT